MKGEKIFRAVGDVGEDLIEQAGRSEKKKTVWLQWAALAACCALVVGAAMYSGVLWGGKSSAPENASAQDATAETMQEAPAEPEEFAAAETPETTMQEAPREEEMGDARDAEPADAAPEEKAEEPQRTIRFNGQLYVQLAEPEEDYWPGELLGTAEAAEPDSLNGCAVYACEGKDAAELVLVLADDVYWPFAGTETVEP